jgi:tetratricopeptide (TPR) repeat protein
MDRRTIGWVLIGIATSLVLYGIFGMRNKYRIEKITKEEALARLEAARQIEPGKFREPQLSVEDSQRNRISELTERIAREPGNSQLRADRSNLYFYEGNLETSLKDIEAGLRLDPARSVLETLGQKKDALTDLGRAIEQTEVGDRMQSLLIRRATLALDTRACDQALADVNTCIKLFGENSLWYSMRALIHEAMHNPVAATVDSKKARELRMMDHG